MTAKKYRKKPVVIEAMRLHADLDNKDSLDANTHAHAEIAGWMFSHQFNVNGFKVHGDKAPFGLAIETLEGVMIAKPGDWIIRGIQGEFYPCDPDIFAATYEAVSEPEPETKHGSSS